MDASHPTGLDEREFSEAVTELSEMERLAEARVAAAKEKKLKILSLSRQKAQEILAKAAERASHEKAKVVETAEEENLKSARKIVADSEKQAHKVRAQAAKRIPACVSSLYSKLVRTLEAEGA